MNLSKTQLVKIQKKFKFSKREMSILELLLSDTESMKDMAKAMKVSERMIKNYMQRIFLKTGRRKKLSAVLKCLDIFDLR